MDEVTPIIEDAQHVLTVDHDLTFDESTDNRFKVEINLGLALPFKYYITDDYDKTQENKAIVRSVNDDGSVYMLEVTTQSNEGPLQAFENDVLLVLLTMAWEQRDKNHNSKERKNGFRVYYTLAEVCRRLGLSENSRNKVARAINKIKSQKMLTKNFAYNALSGDIGLVSEDTRIILKSGRVRVGASDLDFGHYQDVFYIEFDSYIVKNLYDEYVSVINSDAYLSLKSGPQRRVLIFLYSKRKKFGNQFLFDLEELAQVVGLSGSNKRRRQINEYLQRICDVLNNFEFTLKKKRGVEDWSVLVCFKSQALEYESKDPFYSALCEFYGVEKLKSLEIEKIDIENLKNEFNFKYQKEAGKDYFLYGKDKIDPAEFAIDVTLFQVLVGGYKLTGSFKALSKVILSRMIDGGLELPEKYRHFVVARVEEEKKKEVDKKIACELHKKEEIRRVEKEKLEHSFDKLYGDMISKNKSFKDSLERRAVDALKGEGLDETDMMYRLSLEHKMRDIAKVDFMNGDIINYKDIKRVNRVSSESNNQKQIH